MLERQTPIARDETGLQLELSPEQVMLKDVLAKLFAEFGDNQRLRKAGRAGFDGELWHRLWELGVLQLRVPGEGDGSLMHAIVVAEEAGRHLASAPITEAMVVRRLIALLDLPADHWLAVAGQEPVVISLAFDDLRERPDQMLLSGAVGEVVLGIEDGELFAWRDLSRQEMPEIHGALPASRLSLLKAGVKEKITHPSASRHFQAAREELRLLNAAMVASAGLASIDVAARYAAEREAFGRRIGEFQGISHPLANAFTDLDGARLLCWRVADAIAREEPDAAAKLAMAAWWAGTAARPAALFAMRTLGGYGMTLEYTSELYFRRINGWSLAESAPDAALDLVAERLWEGRDIELPAAGDVGVTFHWGMAGDRAADRMRAFITQRHDAKMKRFMRESIDGFDRELHVAMAAEGLLYPDAPTEYGGPGLSAIEAFATRDVFGDYYWNILAPSVSDMIAKTVHHFGSEQAKREVLPGIYSGEKYCTLGYSEPSGGSDIFACRTTAVRDGDEWRINGQKQFTSTAHLADYALMVTRTGPDKYRGITIFIVPLNQPGFSLTEIKTIGEERTNSTFFDNVRVPDAYRIGEVNGGVKVLAAALVIEQSAGDLHVMSMRTLIREVRSWLSKDHPTSKSIDTLDLRRALAETAVRLEIQDALNRRALWANDSGNARKHYGPMAKLFGSESWLKTAGRIMEAAAPASLEVGVDGLSMAEFLLRRAIPATIYAGTSEIQRSLIAEAGLSLPRSR